MESFLQFFIKNNTLIIEVLIGLILVSIVYLAFRTFMAPESKTSGAALGGDIEETLKKILEKANAVTAAAATAPAAAPPPPGVDAAAIATATADQANLLAEIDTLKKSLEEKKGEIDKLKSSAGASAASGEISGEDKSKLEVQIKELQSKLQEYEIISEDIADLSHYKEENAKLQKELEALKAGGVAPVAAAAAPAQTPTAAATPAGASAKEEPAIVGSAKATPPPPPEPEPVATVAPVQPPQPAPTASDKTPIPAAVAAEVEPKTPEEAKVVDQEIMAEFEKAANAKEGDGSAEGPDLGSMDMDKMLAEAAGITSAPVDAPAENALEAGLNEDKLLQEASALTDVKPEDKALMNDFENFVKKPS